MKRPLASLLCLLAHGPVGATESPLRLDPSHSQVEIEVKATVDSFTGHLEHYEAGVSIDPQTGAVTGAQFSFHFKDVLTGKADRDQQMHLWQDTAHHPDGVFILAKLTRQEDGGMTASGKLTLHGLTRDITFPVAITHEGPLYAIDGDAELDTRLFGLPVIKKLLLLKVDPVVHVRFHLQGRVADPASDA